MKNDFFHQHNYQSRGSDGHGLLHNGRISCSACTWEAAQCGKLCSIYILQTRPVLLHLHHHLSFQCQYRRYQLCPRTRHDYLRALLPPRSHFYLQLGKYSIYCCNWFLGPSFRQHLRARFSLSCRDHPLLHRYCQEFDHQLYLSLIKHFKVVARCDWDPCLATSLGSFSSNYQSRFRVVLHHQFHQWSFLAADHTRPSHLHMGHDRSDWAFISFSTRPWFVSISSRRLCCHLVSLVTSPFSTAIGFDWSKYLLSMMLFSYYLLYLCFWLVWQQCLLVLFGHLCWYHREISSFTGRIVQQSFQVNASLRFPPWGLN